jgi:carbon-monoxide dehydrogenase medium subunit
MHFDYHRPISLNQAFELMQQSSGPARYIAGGTDLMVQIKQGLIRPETLISLRNIPELQGIEEAEAGLRIKGLTLMRDIETHPLIREQTPVLQQAVASLANIQVRNVATLGGNLVNASPAADSIPPLLVLDSRLVLAGPEGERTVDIADFFLGPGQTALQSGEILKAVTIPRHSLQAPAAFMKIGRSAQDLALVNAAALLRMEEGTCTVCRLAAGAVGSTPLRLKQAEALLTGRSITAELLDTLETRVRETVSPISDVRAGAAYRRDLAGTLVKRSIEEALGIYA